MTVEVESAADETVSWVHRIRSLVLTNAAGGRLSRARAARRDRMASAEERFERTFNANPAPAVICRLDDLRYVKVNQGFLDLTGHARDDVLGRSVCRSTCSPGRPARPRDRAARRRRDDPADGGRAEARGRQHEGRGGRRAADRHERRGVHAVHVHGSRAAQAERALRQSERFATAFRMAPVATAIVTADRFELLDVNDAFAALTGHAQDDLLGKSADEIGLWAERGVAHRRPARARRQRAQRRRADPHARGRRARLRRVGRSVAIHGRDCLLVALLDISDRKRTEMGSSTRSKRRCRMRRGSAVR